MLNKFSALALGVMTAAVLVYSTSSFAGTASQVTNAAECAQGIKDSLEARANEPELGPKAAKSFDEIIELAKQRCAGKEYSNAAELLNIARGMVASE